MHPALFRLIRFAPYVVVFAGWASTIVGGYVRGLKKAKKESQHDKKH